MKRLTTQIFVLIGMCLLAVACEKAVFDQDDKTPQTSDEQGVKMVFNVAGLEQIQFAGTAMATRAETAALASVCSRINLMVYQDGTRVKMVNQKAGDKDFGRIDMTLTPGDYELVVLAHSCEGNATTTNPNKLTFPSNKLTDTFYHYERLSVSKDQERQLQLKRAVAMFRLVAQDAMPQNVARMRFYYTGGSSTLDAAQGFGCVNSKQTEYRDVTDDMKGKATQFEVFTFPHAESGALKMNIQALDANDAVVKEMTLDDVPVTLNRITQYSGAFFSSEDNGASGFSLAIDDEWAGTTEHTF